VSRAAALRHAPAPHLAAQRRSAEEHAAACASPPRLTVLARCWCWERRPARGSALPEQTPRAGSAGGGGRRKVAGRRAGGRGCERGLRRAAGAGAARRRQRARARAARRGRGGHQHGHAAAAQGPGAPHAGRGGGPAAARGRALRGAARGARGQDAVSTRRRRRSLRRRGVSQGREALRAPLRRARLAPPGRRGGRAGAASSWASGRVSAATACSTACRLRGCPATWWASAGDCRCDA